MREKMEKEMATPNSPRGNAQHSDGRPGCWMWILVTVVLIASQACLVFHITYNQAIQEQKTLLERAERRLDALETKRCQCASNEDAKVKADGSGVRVSGRRVGGRVPRSVGNSHHRRLEALRAQYFTLSNRLTNLEAYLVSQRTHTAVHVVASQAKLSPALPDGTLQWQRDDWSMFDSEDYGFDENYTSITANTAGVFLVNLQLTFNGRTRMPFISSSPCSFVVKRCSSSDGDSGCCEGHADIIMYGATTQYKLGQSISRSVTDPMYAFDTVFTSKLVALDLHDKVCVQLITPACAVLTHEEKTYLEIVLINRG